MAWATHHDTPHALVRNRTEHRRPVNWRVRLHGHEAQVFADAGYIGVDKREEMAGKVVKWHDTVKRGKIKAMQEGTLKDLIIALERTTDIDRSAFHAARRENNLCN